MTRALLIPAEGPLREIELDGSLEQLQELVGGRIQALPLPDFIDPNGRATAYVNEEGKYEQADRPNMRATDFLVPGVGLFFGDHVAGDMLLCGFDSATGDHADLPDAVAARARLIEREASP